MHGHRNFHDFRITDETRECFVHPPSHFCRMLGAFLATLRALDIKLEVLRWRIIRRIFCRKFDEIQSLGPGYLHMIV